MNGYATRPRGPRSAFTLIELLVVVAVVGVLAALLMPALKTAREKARVLQCAGNLRQICVALRAYSADYGGIAVPDTPTSYWQWAIDAYLTSRPANAQPSVVYSPAWNCPKNPSRQVVSSPRPGYSGGYLAYNVNSQLVGQNGLPNTYLGSVRHAERKVYYVETDWQVWWANHGGSATSISYAYVDTEGFFGHSGGMNILFCDGHVEWAPQASPILEGTSAASSRYWSPKSD